MGEVGGLIRLIAIAVSTRTADARTQLVGQRVIATKWSELLASSQRPPRLHQQAQPQPLQRILALHATLRPLLRVRQLARPQIHALDLASIAGVQARVAGFYLRVIAVRVDAVQPHQILVPMRAKL